MFKFIISKIFKSKNLVLLKTKYKHEYIACPECSKHILNMNEREVSYHGTVIDTGKRTKKQCQIVSCTNNN